MSCSLLNFMPSFGIQLPIKIFVGLFICFTCPLVRDTQWCGIGGSMLLSRCCRPPQCVLHLRSHSFCWWRDGGLRSELGCTIELMSDILNTVHKDGCEVAKVCEVPMSSGMAGNVAGETQRPRDQR